MNSTTFEPALMKIERACRYLDIGRSKLYGLIRQRKLDAVKWDMLEEWSKTKRAPHHAAFLHQREFKQ